MRKIVSAGLAILSLSANAGVITSPPVVDSPWSYGVGLGYSSHQGMIADDGQTVLGRLFLAREMTKRSDIAIGWELGFQTGNNSRLSLTPRQNFDLGNVAVQTFIKPMADLLITFNKPMQQGCSGFVKAGVTYRQMHYDRDTVNSLKKIDPEVQVGLSKRISDSTSLSLAYQGVYSGKVGLTTTNPSGLLGQGTGTVRNIPTQHGVLLTVTAKA